MKITYLKPPYIAPTCRVGEMKEMVITTSAVVEEEGNKKDPTDPTAPDDPNAPFSAKGRFYNGYGNSCGEY